MPQNANHANPIDRFRARKEILTVSNSISAFRVLLVVPAVLAVVAGSGVLAASIFFLAYLTDILDGYIARKRGEVSEYGKIIDPLADKIFIASVGITMLVVGMLPVWFIIVILARDILIFSAGVWAGRKFNTVLPSNYPGKAAALSISLTFFVAVLGLEQPVLVFFEYLSILLMALSLALYAARLRGLLQSSRL